MDTLKICPNCQKPLGSNQVDGLCPECLLRSGVEETKAGIVPDGGLGTFVPPNPEDLAPHFPELEIIELLGKGGMGAVYKARQKTLDRMVALKILPPEVGRDTAFEERFGREARALARLNHPNVVTVHDFGQKAHLFYFLMEYVDGSNLRQLLRSQKLTPRECMNIVPCICEALQYAHDEGVVHRDIKPENILIDKKGRVKIADFGLAKMLGKGASGFDACLTQTSVVMGTPQYMAPEQLERPMEVDHRADIYSLGVVFYEMLTGELPIGRFAPPSKKVEVDVRMDEIVLRALEKEPERRYQQASQFKTQVETLSFQAPPLLSSLNPPVIKPVSARIKSMVQAPAVGLLILGLLKLTPFFKFSFSFNKVFGFVAGILIIIGGAFMHRMQCYFLAVASAGLCIVTSSIYGFSNGLQSLICLGVGIWALTVLLRKEVREAFDSHDDGVIRKQG